LEKAVALLGSGVAVHIRWRPFQLNPGMPTAGMDRRVYRSQKFGSWKRSLALDSEVKRVGATEEIVFRHDLIRKTPRILLRNRFSSGPCADPVTTKHQ
jgi:predicted DsbA family dithiol-disulfide isomerase